MSLVGCLVENLPEDIIKLILNIISPSSYICLLNTSKLFRCTKRTFDKHEIINDAIKCPKIGIYILNLGFHYKAEPIFTLYDFIDNYDLFVTAYNTGTKFDFDRTVKEAILNNKFEVADFLSREYNDYNKFFKYACEYYQIGMIERNIKFANVKYLYTFGKERLCLNLLELLNKYYKDVIYSIVINDTDLIFKIINSGSFSLLKWTENIYPDIKNKKYICSALKTRNNFELLSYCKDNGYKQD
jgi:hypothetical protein